MNQKAEGTTARIELFPEGTVVSVGAAEALLVDVASRKSRGNRGMGTTMRDATRRQSQGKSTSPRDVTQET